MEGDDYPGNTIDFQWICYESFRCDKGKIKLLFILNYANRIESIRSIKSIDPAGALFTAALLPIDLSEGHP